MHSNNPKHDLITNGYKIKTASNVKKTTFEINLFLKLIFDPLKKQKNQ